METNTAPIARHVNEWITPAALRALLKSNLKLNARQVTVRTGSSNQYLTITIRDAAVDVATVKAFAAKLHTWTMDNTDYVEGQSIHVETTKEVDAIHAAPFVAEIVATLPKVTGHYGQRLAGGCFLWLDEVQGYYVSRDQSRRHYVNAWDVKNGTPWAIQALALSVARLTPKQ